MIVKTFCHNLKYKALLHKLFNTRFFPITCYFYLLTPAVTHHVDQYIQVIRTEAEVSPGICDRFVRLHAARSSSSSSSKSRRAVASDAVSTTTGPMLSVSGSCILPMKPARLTHLSTFTVSSV